MKKSYKKVFLIIVVLMLSGPIMESIRISMGRHRLPLPVLSGIQLLCILGSIFLDSQLTKYNKKPFVSYISISIANILFVSLALFIFHSITQTPFIYIRSISISFTVSLYFIFADQIERNRAKKQENEELKSQKSKAEMEVLKQQINPHFLFNSLNTLKELIEEDQGSAVQYLQKFSKLYRYVLASNGQDLVRIEEELEFLEKYFQLLQKRFGDRLTMSLHNSEVAKGKLIPPMSLQLLLENAIKHNEVSNEHPLHVDFTFHPDSVEIENKVKSKTSFVQSNGLGLSNLEFRVRHFLHKEITFGFTENQDKFRVLLPISEQI
ncbi:sensor histidine kinase [Flammeovirgaceae bacterium SG7u.111]|nr:sensor histidine kinase [Flammeovirgaceae bacterium SG7u.132]WPO34666.1 sensor histidine kinase [Flammeovirgaceae bacterium SG7u.111]